MLKIIKNFTLEDILLLLCLITLPLPEHWNSKALLLMLILVMYSLYKNFDIKFPKISWLYILFFIFSSLSYFWSADKYETLKALVRLSPFLLFTIAHKQIFKFNSLDSFIRISAIIYLFYGVLWLLLAYYRFSQGGSLDTFFYHELTAPFKANAIYIALIFGQLYLFLLYQILFSTKINKSIDYFLTFFLFAFQLLLSSKMILSVLILVSIMLFAMYLKKIGWRKKILSGALVIVVSLLMILGISSFTKNRFRDIVNLKQIENVFSREYFGPVYYWNGLTLRLFQLRCFYEIEKESNFKSLLGTGFNAGQSVLNKKYSQYDLYRGPSGEGKNDGYFIYNFHNQYVQLLIEIGVLGIILILLLFYYFVIFPIKNKNILLLSVTFLFISIALTESFLLRQKGVVSFVIFPLLAMHKFENQNQIINS